MTRKTDNPARRRAEIILQVRSGRITATQAARLLGISRKSYYRWEQRGLDAMLSALEQRDPGRPPQPAPDPETLRLRKRVAQLEKNLELMREVRQLREDLAEFRGRANQPPERPRANPKKKP